MYLARLGYDVTIYERREKPGGLDTYGMAEYKMPQSVSLAEAEQVAAMGVKILLNTEIAAKSVPPASAGGETVTRAEAASPETDVPRSSPLQSVSMDELKEWHDAVFLAAGLGETNRLNIPGEELNGVYDALHFIELVKSRDWMSVPLGKRVAVIGAGNTAVDAATQAKRLGAERVMMVYRRTENDISAYDYEYELAKKDGIEFVWQSAPIGVLGDDDYKHVAALQCERTDGSLQLFDIPCDMVIKAVGQQKRRSFFESVVGVEVDEKGRVVVNEIMQTSDPKVFAGGDCANGGAEAVDASQMGKLAAQGIHLSLTGETVRFAGSPIPVR
jgi:glutamate synthase (NADPH/NADH) small chain